MKRFFISDLHLDEQRPEISQALGTFLDTHAKNMDELYILGDFFEVWVGDDYQSPFISNIKAMLKQASSQGTKLFFMHGNRDFLMGTNFAKEVGWTLLSEPASIKWQDKTVLLMHGDSLCTADIDYMAFRKQVRSTLWQSDFLSKPLAERLAIAQQLRQQSKEAYTNKPDAITDVTPAAVEQLFHQHTCEILIHGHTHRPKIHTMDTGEQKRIVLGDWDKFGWFLKMDDEHYQLSKFEIKDTFAK